MKYDPVDFCQYYNDSLALWGVSGADNIKTLYIANHTSMTQMEMNGMYRFASAEARQHLLSPRDLNGYYTVMMN